ncbi:hypothetical protein CEXT_575861 [Caerostris extrusa]|uniref:Uncharacterized protein n=1 Tax=Caerostris extrusa TaxID=172846 RepID=A0AAV4R9U7_CAEEX|nr:hypothetical protein CEXT_575861 [Caerostris extrusa]
MKRIQTVPVSTKRTRTDIKVQLSCMRRTPKNSARRNECLSGSYHRDTGATSSRNAIDLSRKVNSSFLSPFPQQLVGSNHCGELIYSTLH